MTLECTEYNTAAKRYSRDLLSVITFLSVNYYHTLRGNKDVIFNRTNKLKCAMYV